MFSDKEDGFVRQNETIVGAVAPWDPSSGWQVWTAALFSVRSLINVKYDEIWAELKEGLKMYREMLTSGPSSIYSPRQVTWVSGETLYMRKV